MVADGGYSSSSLLCFAAFSSSVFHSFCQQYSSLFVVVSGGAAGEDQEEEWCDDRWFQTAKRERPERKVTVLLSSSVICFFRSLYSVLFPFFSRQLQSFTLSPSGSASGCSRCCWWPWRGRNNGGSQGMRTVFFFYVQRL